MKKTQITVSTLRTGQKADFGDGKARGKVKSIKVRIELEDGSVVLANNWTGVTVIEDDEDLCPNGQSRSECSEIDPCEMCWQDQNEEGDMIEESMGLRKSTMTSASSGCKGCEGTCCTGISNIPCTCP